MEDIKNELKYYENIYSDECEKLLEYKKELMISQKMKNSREICEEIENRIQCVEGDLTFLKDLIENCKKQLESFNKSQ